MATWVSDMNYQRYRSNCPDCGKVDYALDKVLGLRPRQRLSSSVEELSVLCGASWKYEKSEYMMKKVLRRGCVSHETIFNKSNEVGQVASKWVEGAKIKELEGNKKLQGEYLTILWGIGELLILVMFTKVPILQEQSVIHPFIV